MPVQGEKSDWSGGPQLTWSTVIAALGVCAVVAGGAYTIVQNKFDSTEQLASVRQADTFKQIDSIQHSVELIRTQFLELREHKAYKHEQETITNSTNGRLYALETAQRELISHMAHTPVEGKEVDALSASVDKRIELVQQQINDINRQIAASVLQGFTTPHQPSR